MKQSWAILSAACLSLTSLQGATLPSGFTESQVGANLNGAPTAMEIAPDGRIFVCMQGGQLLVIKNGVVLPTSFVSLSVDSSGERGLLGVAFDPSFATNHFVYVYYTTSSAPIHNRISRFTANGDVAVAGSELVLMDLDNLSSATNHNGGAIHFGPGGKLFVAVGENANSANAQTLANRLGKILRINSDGSIPSDNPTTFPGIAGSPTGANRAIWAVGLRNPFTFTFQAGTNRMFINDVGNSTREEINDGIAGSNYGWPNCEGPCSPTNANYRDPLFFYLHTGDPLLSGCAIVGAAFYNPTTPQFPNSYTGKYFYGDLCNGWIRTYDPANGTSAAFASNINTLVDLKVSSDGSLYYLTRGNTGQLFQVKFPSTVVLASAVSRATHGALTFDLPLSLVNSTVESRSGGATGDHQIIATFTGNGPISVDGNPQAQVTAGNAAIGSNGASNGGAVSISGSTVKIPITNAADAQKLTITLNGVNDGTTTRSFTIPLALLLGDSSGDGFVNSGDATITRNVSGHDLDATNFPSDFNLDGFINSADATIVRARSGQFVP